MRILIVDSFRADQAGKPLLDAASAVLTESGHDVDRLDLETSGFPMDMTEEERVRYEDIGNNICCPHVDASVEQVRAADGIVFGYHTTAHTIPAHLKGWLERTMLPGVAFVFNDDNKVRPGLSSIRRVGAITTTPHSRRATWSAANGGRRTLMRSFRANCGPRCRGTFVSIHDRDIEGAPERVKKTFTRW